MIVGLAVTALVSLGFLVGMGTRPALGAGIGGGVMAAGNAVAAWFALGGGIQRPGAAFARLLVGVAGKWLVVMAGFAFALRGLHLPPLPALCGLVASAAAYLLASSRSVMAGQVQRER